jgi:hypothetical protein
LENFGAEILSNLKAMNRMLPEGIPLNFEPVKFKKLLTEKL